MINPKLIVKLDNWTYQVPTYKITDEGIQDGKGIKIRLCRGNKADATAPRQEGMFTESLITLITQYLESVNQGELKNLHTEVALKHLHQALAALDARAEERKNRGVQATYQK